MAKITRAVQIDPINLFLLKQSTVRDILDGLRAYEPDHDVTDLDGQLEHVHIKAQIATIEVILNTMVADGTGID